MANVSQLIRGSGFIINQERRTSETLMILQLMTCSRHVDSLMTVPLYLPKEKKILERCLLEKCKCAKLTIFVQIGR